jgi:hypothetical protein
LWATNGEFGLGPGTIYGSIQGLLAA